VKKEKRTTETVYFCDICGQEDVEENWAYGGHSDAGENLKRCPLCGKDFCPDCGIGIDGTKICKLCAEERKDLIQKWQTIISEYEPILKECHTKILDARNKIFSWTENK
jgi:DNA-directed RNA polymerase subunit RPC12/RpoP